jgi:hypothetical protein
MSNEGAFLFLFFLPGRVSVSGGAAGIAPLCKA